jgi:histidinol-phosphate aminotransferase
LHYGVNRNAQIGALAALEDRAFHRHVIAEVAKGREDYYALARSIGSGYLESHTNFVCIDFGSSERANAVMNALLARGVFIRKPAAPPLDGYVRVSVGTPADRVEFAARLRAVLGEMAA